MLLPLLTLLGAGACVVAAQDASPSVIPPTATISIATLYGTQTSLPSATQAVNKYLGIPFAESPPVRFAPPQPKSNLNGGLDVKEWKPACIQQFQTPLAAQLFTIGVFNQPPPQESEDCLYLNVYAPASPPPDGGRAVMFYIFGGAYMFGTGGQPLYDGSAFAAYQDVIVVTHNYRTNVFGFPTSPQLNASERNLGLMDQRFALQWVQDNIAAFGGDPKKVTIFGESAGGASVDTHITSYTTENAPFRAAIAQSGSVSYQPQNLTNNPNDWAQLVKDVGCEGDSNELDCVRNVPASRVKSVIENNQAAFYATPDNITLMEFPSIARATGNFAAVPVLGGSNAAEGRVYTVAMFDELAFLKKTFASFTDVIPTISTWYSDNNVFPNNVYYRISQIYTDFGFLCPQGLWANASAAQNVPTWLYMYNASFPNSAFLDPSGDSGAYHSSELGVVFQSYADGPINPKTILPAGLLQYQKPATTEQTQLSAFVNKAWADFAKDPASGPGWASVADGTMGIIGGGSEGGTGVLEVQQGPLHGMCSVFMPVFLGYTPGADASLPGINATTGAGIASSGSGGGNGGSNGNGGTGENPSGNASGGESAGARPEVSFGALLAFVVGAVVLSGLKV